MDIDHSLLFVKITCASISEAKKRALVLAYLTYDMARHVFVKLNTAQMLQNPYDIQNVYDVKTLFTLETFTEDVDVRSVFMRQQKQPH